MDAEVSTHTFLTMIIEESVCFMSCEPICFAIILMWYTRNIYIIFCDLLLKSAFERIFNVMQLILVKIK